VDVGNEGVQVRDAAQAWLKKQAKVLFEERLHHFAPLLGVRWQKLSLSSASTRWGSARNDGHIRLNWRLIHFSPMVIDYVIAHELAHLGPFDIVRAHRVIPQDIERVVALRVEPDDFLVARVEQRWRRPQQLRLESQQAEMLLEAQNLPISGRSRRA
jgi:hypothetical protein